MHPARRTVSEAETRRANGREWDGYADEYQATHGEFLGDIGFVWGPEGLNEDEARVLGDVAGRDVLEVGCGAGQCSRWLATPRRPGRRPRPLRAAAPALPAHRRGDRRRRSRSVAGTATALPFADAAFDVVFCSFGALQFVPTSTAPSPRRPGCCGRAAGSRSRSPTRPAGAPRRPVGGGAGRRRRPTGTARRTSRWTTTAAASPTSSTTARSATGSACWPRAGSGSPAARAGVARGARPRLGRLGPRARPAHAGDRDVRADLLPAG